MPPFVSEKQRKYLYSQKPEVAKKFAEHGSMKKKRMMKKKDMDNNMPWGKGKMKF